MLCECILSLSLASYHFDRSREWNEVNPGITVEKDNVIVGGYYNSHRRTTLFMGVVFPLARVDGLQLGATFAVGTGYRSPLLAAFRGTVGRHTFTFVPPIGQTSGVVAYSYIL